MVVLNCTTCSAHFSSKASLDVMMVGERARTQSVEFTKNPRPQCATHSGIWLLVIYRLMPLYFVGSMHHPLV